MHSTGELLLYPDAIAFTNVPTIDQIDQAISGLRTTEAEVENLETKAGKSSRLLAVSAGVEPAFDLFYSQRRCRNGDIGTLYLYVQDFESNDRASRRAARRHWRMKQVRGAYERVRGYHKTYRTMLESIYAQAEKDYEAWIEAVDASFNLNEARLADTHSRKQQAEKDYWTDLSAIYVSAGMPSPDDLKATYESSPDVMEELVGIQLKYQCAQARFRLEECAWNLELAELKEQMAEVWEKEEEYEKDRERGLPVWGCWKLEWVPKSIFGGSKERWKLWKEVE